MSESLENTRHQYELVPGIPVPRNSRQVGSALPGTNERIVSDLIPTAAITADWPLLGDTMASIRWMNEPVDDCFAEFVLVNMTREDGWFTRLWFSRDYSATDPTTGLPYYQTPVDTEKKFGDFPWPAILKNIYIVPDYSVTRTTRAFDGTVNIMPTYNVYPDVVEEATKGTLTIIETFLSNSHFELPLSEAPVTRTVVVPLPGGENFTFHRCLCDKIVIEQILTNAGALSQNGNPIAAGPGAAIPGQIIPATNFITWRPYIDSVEETSLDNGLYMLKVKTVYNPKVPESTILLQ